MPGGNLFDAGLDYFFFVLPFFGRGPGYLGDDQIHVARFHQVIKGALFHAVDGGFDIRMTGKHDDFYQRKPFFDFRQCFDSVHPRYARMLTAEYPWLGKCPSLGPSGRVG